MVSGSQPRVVPISASGSGRSIPPRGRIARTDALADLLEAQITLGHSFFSLHAAGHEAEETGGNGHDCQHPRGETGEYAARRGHAQQQAGYCVDLFFMMIAEDGIEGILDTTDIWNPPDFTSWSADASVYAACRAYR